MNGIEQMFVNLGMRYIFIIALLVVGTTGYAQDVPIGSPTQENLPRDPEQELQSLSGSLKELHGQVHQRLGIIEKRLTSATDKAKDKLATQREELQEARLELENTLELVNTANPEDWEMTKTNAEEVIERVTETLDRTKDTSTSAVN